MIYLIYKLNRLEIYNNIVFFPYQILIIFFWLCYNFDKLFLSMKSKILLLIWLTVSINTCAFFWLDNVDRLYYQEEMQWPMDAGLYHIKEDLWTSTWAFYYTGIPSSAGSNISLKYDSTLYVNLNSCVKKTWYYWIASGFAFNDFFGPLSLSVSTKRPNSLVARNAFCSLPDDEVSDYYKSTLLLEQGQSSTWYWMWISQTWDVYGNWKWDSDPFNSLNYFTWTTIWRPMPFDKDGDVLSDNADNNFWYGSINSDPNRDIDNDGLKNGERDIDSDNDGWTDGEEYQLWTNPLDSTKFPTDSDADWINDQFFTEYLTLSLCVWKTWPDDDCDWDWLNNKQEQEFWSDPTMMNTAWTWFILNDKQRFDFWLKADWFQDRLFFDEDGLSNEAEILGYDKTIQIKDQACVSRTIILKDVTDPYLDDTDYDWISDSQELLLGLNPRSYDTDLDWIPDLVDSAPLDWCSWIVDPDADWLPSSWFVKNNEIWDSKLNPDEMDADSNWVLDGNEDFDDDWLTNLEEFIFWTDPNNADSDWDWIKDWDEIKFWLNPNDSSDASRDNDGDWWWKETYCSDAKNLNNLEEINNFLTDSNSRDTDWDGLTDDFEFAKWLDPRNPDTDWDWVPDGVEWYLHMINSTYADPLNGSITPVDSDWDWLYNVFENKYTFWGESNRLYDKENKVSWIDVTWSWTYELAINKSDSNGNVKSDSSEDFDWDWLANIEEQSIGTNPFKWDTDWDWISDQDEIILWFDPLDPSDWYADFDWDWLSNATELNWLNLLASCGWVGIKVFPNLFKADTDWDWLNDKFEIENFLDPTNPDSDWDGINDWVELRILKDPMDLTDANWNMIPDAWEAEYGVSDPQWDPDNDWLTNIEEFVAGSDPTKADSDSDGINDWDEVRNGLNPLDPKDAKYDNDWDWLTNLQEINGQEISGFEAKCGTSSWVTKTIMVKTNPNSSDSDWDWLDDNFEILHKLDPNNIDTDWDWVPDWIETRLQEIDPLNSDPLDWAITPQDTDWDWLFDIFEMTYSEWWLNSTWVIISSNWQIYTIDNPKPSGVDVIGDINYELKIDNVNSNWNQIWDWEEDFDRDGLTNAMEQFYWTDPNNWDTDWDSIPDAYEIMMWSDPLWWAWCNIIDYDWDGIKTIDEVRGISMTFIITDSWGTVTSSQETVYTNPLVIDTDSDWLSDFDEVYTYRTNPTILDTDLDGFGDGLEINLGFDPLSALSILPSSQCDWWIYDAWKDKLWSSCSWQSWFEDCDWDWIMNIQEEMFWTDPSSSDTDSDWIPDEIDPYPIDWCNKDYLCKSNCVWRICKTVPPGYLSDKDHDWLSDKQEISWWTASYLWTWRILYTGNNFFDSDCDWLWDWLENAYHLDPTKNDSDWFDYVVDWIEMTKSAFDVGDIRKASWTSGILDDLEYWIDRKTPKWTDLYKNFFDLNYNFTWSTATGFDSLEFSISNKDKQVMVAQNQLLSPEWVVLTWANQDKEEQEKWLVQSAFASLFNMFK